MRTPAFCLCAYILRQPSSEWKIYIARIEHKKLPLITKTVLKTAKIAILMKNKKPYVIIKKRYNVNKASDMNIYQ